MAQDTLASAMATIGAQWGPLSSELVETVRSQLAALASASPEEPWLAGLLRDQPESRELHRDTRHGFVLLAHFEGTGQYRPPHDHGRSWVVYAVQRGEIEMGTYGRIDRPGAKARLVKRDASQVRAGDVQVYLPGDVHDTLCVAGPALLLRFTERDLKTEDAFENRVTRYQQREGAWCAP